MSIVSAFDHAAQGYDAAADIQRIVTEELIARAAHLQPRSILDIGCGTGLLTALARKHWPDGAITAVDAAPAMLATARAKLPGVRFIEADAARLPFSEKFDLVLSSMVLHWLPAEALTHWQSLVAPGGALRIAFPVEGSLGEWRALCQSQGLEDRLWKFPQAVPNAEIRRHTLVYPSAREFLLAMKHTGAASADPARPALTPRQMRALLRAAPKPFAATFLIAYL
ncbi:trans-aconitate methyltransferase [Rhizomicrobium palustre]|uniref:Trans-aconitate methyltransferase n=1 Tax=Rhizomicrobium palustre TaxID=189966 RepID=A0A846N085_9PROT|nr:methyltransferase domain-containing protein [Rhizomicrobium palustre]NIK89096.1 trans-aconitate methyltransferase [Rhizomicrobium palustre]